MKTYQIFLKDIKIGTTQFEKADPSMGVVYGVIFLESFVNYRFIKDYCSENKIELAFDYPEDNVISTQTLSDLKVYNAENILIEYAGNQITGMNSENFEIVLEGIAYPFFEVEFPDHVKDYNDLYKERK